jgi:branched-subunit amino acid ABC-type transport system permease component
VLDPFLKASPPRCWEGSTACRVQFKNTLTFLVIVVVLLFRPDGLLGREFRERV